MAHMASCAWAGDRLSKEIFSSDFAMQQPVGGKCLELQGLGLTNYHNNRNSNSSNQNHSYINSDSKKSNDNNSKSNGNCWVLV